MIYTRYSDCTHCQVLKEEMGDTYFESNGCEHCNQTGKRILTRDDLEMFEEAREFITEKLSDVYELYQRKILKRERYYSLESFSFSPMSIPDHDYFFISSSLYCGYGETERYEEKMPAKYFLAKNPAEFIQKECFERDEAIKQEEIERSKRLEIERQQAKKQEEAKALQDAIDAEANELAEYHRLKAKYEEKGKDT